MQHETASLTPLVHAELDLVCGGIPIGSQWAKERAAHPPPRKVERFARGALLGAFAGAATATAGPAMVGGALIWGAAGGLSTLI